jgi:STE24 endopeptidase
MNDIAWIILTALLLEFGLNTLAGGLNMRAARPEPPEGFARVYDPERYLRSQRYLRVNTRFDQLKSAVDLVVVLIFWFGRGFPLLDRWVMSLTTDPLFAGLLFIGSLVLLKGVVDLPFAVYDTFVIEERFGFNRTTMRTFCMDLLRKILLGGVLGGGALVGILAFFLHAGDDAWWICWLAVTIIILVLQYVAPVWIMPLFNRFTPVEDGVLKQRILAYARSIQFPLENVMIMDGSKRSAKGNAFFTGFGRHRRIVLYDTLVAETTVDELVAILAHEMGHYKKKHIQSMMVLGILQMGLVFYLLSLFISHPALFEAFFMPAPSLHAGLVFFGMLYAPIDLFLGILVKWISRSNEVAADRFAAETTGSGRTLATALIKLTAANLSNLTPHPFYVWLHYSHPSVPERVSLLAG